MVKYPVLGFGVAVAANLLADFSLGAFASVPVPFCVPVIGATTGGQEVAVHSPGVSP